ncbi:hypothetical protein Pmani_029009 [Petrolisthes manimaculis]|uniref:GH18 domain-containing protein n=1 Tax=Petrolisthes manimaculis TaxID=1843537 RepID=A0AAE1TUA5_9EUCA|nr:hypothetical protein Pmani_029009 [Petrolisthes manimaculis]
MSLSRTSSFPSKSNMIIIHLDSLTPPTTTPVASGVVPIELLHACMNTMWTTLLHLSLILAAAQSCGEVRPRAEVLCYYSGAVPLSSSSLDPCLCTVIVAGPTTLDNTFRPVSDIDFTELASLKTTNPHLKIVASLGGSRMKGETFSLLTSSAEGLANFTQGASDFINEMGLDGLEMDWRWPGQQGGAKDRQQLTTLMKVLRLVLDQQGHRVRRSDLTQQHEDDTTTTTELYTTTQDDPITTITTTTTTDDYATISTIEDYYTTIATDDELETVTPSMENENTDEYLTTIQDIPTVTEVPAATTTTTTLTTESWTESVTEYIQSLITTIIPDLSQQEEEDSLGSDYLVLDTGSEYEVTLRPLHDQVRVRGQKVKDITTKLVPYFRNNNNNKGTGKSKPEPSPELPYRGRVKFRDYYTAKTIPTTTVPNSTTSITSKPEGWKLARKDDEDREEALLLALEDRQQRPTNILMLTVAPKPEYIVKGYDLKELAKIVDWFSLPTHNLTEEAREEGQHETFHHTRLMGVSDLQNADSLVDLVAGLGVPLDHMVLGIPTMAALFTLQNTTLTTPRSPALQAPTFIPYPQVCQMVRGENMTVERDEDLTAPYAFSNNTWLAFDDPTSVKIKTMMRPMTTSHALHQAQKNSTNNSLPRHAANQEEIHQ